MYVGVVMMMNKIADFTGIYFKEQGVMMGVNSSVKWTYLGNLIFNQKQLGTPCIDQQKLFQGLFT